MSLAKKHFLLRNMPSAQEGFVGKQVHESVPTFLFLVVLREKKKKKKAHGIIKASAIRLYFQV